MNPRLFLLFTKSFSDVPLYADENDFVKYTYVFRYLPVCRLYRHTEIAENCDFFIQIPPAAENYFVGQGSLWPGNMQ